VLQNALPVVPALTVEALLLLVLELPLLLELVFTLVLALVLLLMLELMLVVLDVADSDAPATLPTRQSSKTAPIGNFIVA
jgi:hypothetical protein